MGSKKKKGGLAAAASKKLAGIGGPRMSPVQGPKGTQMLKPTPEMLAALDRFAHEDHNH